MPEWLSYIGTVTGVAGSVMGYVSLRRTAQLTTRGMRLDLCRRKADVVDALERLPTLIGDAVASRRAVAAALGTVNDRNMVKWTSDVDDDRHAQRDLQKQLHAIVGDHAKLTASDLETKLVDIHRLGTKVEHYTNKYRAALAGDDKTRDYRN